MSSSNGSATRIALVGAGAWGSKLLRAFGEVDGARWVAVCDPDPAALARMPSLRPYRELGDLLRDADAHVDALVIASPPHRHHPQAREGLRAGKHVFVEKPLALERRHADELVELSDRRRRVLMVGHVMLYDPAVRWIQQHARSQAMGEVHHAELVRVNLGRIRPDVGAIWNLAPHDVAMANYWFGEPVLDARAEGMCLLEPGREDVAFVELDYAEARRAHIHVSWLDSLRRRCALLVGTRQLVALRDEAGRSRVDVYRGGIARGAVDDPRQRARVARLSLDAEAEPRWSPALPSHEPLALEARHFIDCVRGGVAPLTDGRSGAAVVAALERAHATMHRAAPHARVAAAS
jgi:predicted dehydrogenase